MNPLMFLAVVLVILMQLSGADPGQETEAVETNPTNATVARKDGILNKLNQVGRYQSVGVQGRLFCGLGPMGQVTVKLWDKDKWDPDDLMAEVETDDEGHFNVSGTAISVFKIDPQLRIYHKCNNNYGICKRKFTFTIPETYISGSKVDRWFELGSLNLEVLLKNKEDEFCY